MKGKKAAQAAGRRAETAQEQVASLRAQLHEAETARRREVVALNDELRRLRSALDQEVEERAERRVEAVESRSRAEIERVRADYADRAAQMEELFMQHGFVSHGMEALARSCLALFGRTLHLAQPDGSSSRIQRRMEKHRPRQLQAALTHLEANPGKTTICSCGNCS